MMAAITGTFQILWVYYGILIASRPVIAWNVVAVLIFPNGTARTVISAIKKSPNEWKLTDGNHAFSLGGAYGDNERGDSFTPYRQSRTPA